MQSQATTIAAIAKHIKLWLLVATDRSVCLCVYAISSAEKKFMKNELRNIREKPKQWQKPQSNDIIVENYSQPTFVWKLKADEMWCENRQWASGVQKNKH